MFVHVIEGSMLKRQNRNIDKSVIYIATVFCYDRAQSIIHKGEALFTTSSSVRFTISLDKEIDFLT